MPDLPFVNFIIPPRFYKEINDHNLLRYDVDDDGERVWNRPVYKLVLADSLPSNLNQMFDSNYGCLLNRSTVNVVATSNEIKHKLVKTDNYNFKIMPNDPDDPTSTYQDGIIELGDNDITLKAIFLIDANENMNNNESSQGQDFVFRYALYNDVISGTFHYNLVNPLFNMTSGSC